MMKKIGQPTNVALVDWTFSKLCAFDDGNNGYFVVTNGIKMRGIFAARNETTTRLDKSDVKACPKYGKRPHPDAAQKPLEGHAAIDTFDEQISSINLVIPLIHLRCISGSQRPRGPKLSR